MTDPTSFNALDLSAGFGYGLMFQPILAFIDKTIYPLIIRPTLTRVKRKIYSPKTK